MVHAIDVDEDNQAKTFIKLILCTGMRRSELFRLEWKDVDFKTNFIFIREPKGGTNQKVPLNSSARALLVNHERPYPESSYIFPRKNGNQRKEIRLPVNRIRKRAGLPKDFRPLHGLRHVYASMLASSGKVDLCTLQRLLTHKSPKMTLRYAHLRDDALKKAADVASDIIGELTQGKKKVVV